MPKPTDVQAIAAKLYLLPVLTRVPLKFGRETVTAITCARAAVTIRDARGRTATGWGETPLSVQWAWPSSLPYAPRYEAMAQLCIDLAKNLATCRTSGHPIEIGHAFQEEVLPEVLRRINADRDAANAVPWLAALICFSAFDIALHDAFGILHGLPCYKTYGPEFMSRDLSAYLQSAGGSPVSFSGRYPQDYFAPAPPRRLPAWHLVGGLDKLDRSELGPGDPDDGYPVLLSDWIRTDGLKCLKVKLRGTDSAWDYDRLVRVGGIAAEQGVDWLSADFNCTVTDPAYVDDILDRLRDDQPRIFGMLLYVEQPFPYDLHANRIDVHSVSARKPLFMDESAHDWSYVKLGRELGWTGVALKTCKTQSGALLSLCWAKAHGMPLMVQDLTNPMLAQVPHVLLAAHAGTIMGVETNAMQFYPDASQAESRVHPGLYRRREGCVDLSTIAGPGFGYQVQRIERTLPPPAAEFG